MDDSIILEWHQPHLIAIKEIPDSGVFDVYNISVSYFYHPLFLQKLLRFQLRFGEPSIYFSTCSLISFFLCTVKKWRVRWKEVLNLISHPCSQHGNFLTLLWLFCICLIRLLFLLAIWIPHMEHPYVVCRFCKNSSEALEAAPKCFREAKIGQLYVGAARSGNNGAHVPMKLKVSVWLWLWV